MLKARSGRHQTRASRRGHSLIRADAAESYTRTTRQSAGFAGATAARVDFQRVRMSDVAAHPARQHGQAGPRVFFRSLRNQISGQGESRDGDLRSSASLRSPSAPSLRGRCMRGHSHRSFQHVASEARLPRFFGRVRWRTRDGSGRGQSRRWAMQPEPLMRRVAMLPKSSPH